MVLSTTYFPSIAWIEAHATGEVQIEACENFQKQTSRNRCRIMTANGVERLVVPIIHNGGAKIPIREARVDYTMPWQRTHARAVMSAYRSSPYWEHFSDRIMPLFELRHTFLFDLNCQITEQLLSILKTDSPLVFTEQFRGAQEPPTITHAEYYQVFSERLPFEANLSVIDAIFCEGRLPSAE